MGHCSFCTYNINSNSQPEAIVPDDTNNKIFKRHKTLNTSIKSNFLNLNEDSDNSNHTNHHKTKKYYTVISKHIRHKRNSNTSSNHKPSSHKESISKVRIFHKLSNSKHQLHSSFKKINKTITTTEQLIVQNKSLIQNNLSYAQTKTSESNPSNKYLSSYSNINVIKCNSNNNNSISNKISSPKKQIKNYNNNNTHNADFPKLYTIENKTKDTEHATEEQEQEIEQENNNNNSFCEDGIEVSNEQEIKILNMLKQHNLFKHFDVSILKNIIDNAQGYQIDEGTVIYNEGEKGESFFIIQEGQVQIYSNSAPQNRKILSTGESFGDAALIYNEMKRNESAVALTNLAFYVVFGCAYREISKKYSGNSIEDILLFINNNKWFCYLDKLMKLNLAVNVKREEYSKDAIIYSKRENNTILNKILMVKCGYVEVKMSKNDDNLNKLNKIINVQESFGECQVILDIDINTNYDLIANNKDNDDDKKNNIIIYSLNKDKIIENLGNNYKEVILFSIFKNSILHNNYFKTILLESYFSPIYSLFNIKHYNKPGTIIYTSNINENNINNNNNENNKAVIPIYGSLIEEKHHSQIASQGELYGDEIINLNHSILNNNITTSLDNEVTITLECSWIDIRNKIKELSKNSSLDVFKRVNKLSKMQMFKHLNESRMLELCQVMKKMKFPKGSVVIQEGTEVFTFYVIYKGRVKIQRKGILVREVEEGNCFGEINVLSEEKSDYTVIADTALQCYTLSKETFTKLLIDEHLNEYIKNKMCLEDSNIELTDLYHIKQLGKGRFGTVSLVHNQISLYALKTIPKTYIDSSKQLARYLLEEKNILLSLDFPLIVKLVKTLKTDTLCCLLMEYINGISLEECVAIKIGRNPSMIKFFSACLVIILEYLNKKSIIHRDIKPANIIIDYTTGYIKLLDFGTAKKIRDFTFTLIGTPTCMAPELILGKGYSFPIDYWSLGVSLYFIYYGKYPFGNNVNDIVDIYNQIIHQELVFPFELANDKELREFIMALLNKTPTFRLSSFEKIRDTALFKGFNWKELKELKIKSPYFTQCKDGYCNGNNNSNVNNNKEIKAEKNMNLLKNIRQPFLQYICYYKFDNYPQIQDNELYQNKKDVKNWFEEF